ncbi:MAG TPA: NAD(P)/FAD-dependent oxidoreductase [Solirubrobacterales bacterium]|nr:NAD(P)/FAD-dependent oxidoreductase [Solirubrobacterales bacterium]
MPSTDSPSPIIGDGAAYDAVIVGGSLAGCTAATLLARSGARVALVEKQPDPNAFKRMCSHFIQASGVPTLERLGWLEPILEAGAVRTRVQAWTRWGWINPPPPGNVCVNLRREALDPLMRQRTAEEPGVELMLGRTAVRVLRGDGAVRGVVVRDARGEEVELRAQLTVGADGRDSQVAKLAGLPDRQQPHGRFAYGGYFEGAAPASAPDASFWMLDPQWAAAFPTDSGLTFYAVMGTMDRLPEFKADPSGALVRFISDIPEAPPIRQGRLVEPVLGKIDMTNRRRGPVAPGLAMIGDAALAVDPLFGIGCGWALQSGEWLADSVAPALAGEEPLESGLKRYKRRHARGLGGHAFLINDYATGRPMSPVERLFFSAAARDRRCAELFEAFGTREIGPERAFPRLLPRAIAVNARHALARSAA